MKPTNENRSPAYKNVLRELANDFTKTYGAYYTTDNINIRSIQPVIKVYTPKLRIVEDGEN